MLQCSYEEVAVLHNVAVAFSSFVVELLTTDGEQE